MLNIEENRAWFFTEDPKVSGKMYVMYDKEKTGRRDYEFQQGKKIDEKNLKPIIFNVEDNKRAKLDYILQWDFLANSTNLILANDKALKVLEEVAKDDIQAIPTEIRMPDGTVINDYNLINITTRLDILNKEKSILEDEKWRESWNMYKKCVYNKDCLSNHNFARADNTSLFLTSNKVKQAIEKAGLKGLIFFDNLAGAAVIE